MEESTVVADFIHYQMKKQCGGKATTVTKMASRWGRIIYPSFRPFIALFTTDRPLDEATLPKTIETGMDLFLDRRIGWVGIVMGLNFGAELAVRCSREGKQETDTIIRCVTDYLNRKNVNDWIAEQGGWTEMVHYFPI